MCTPLFQAQDRCCKKKCNLRFDEHHQEEIFKSFWASTKESQDAFLAKGLQAELPKRTVTRTPTVRTVWKFKFLKGNSFVEVCRQFFISVLKITPKRIRVIQKKIADGVIDFSERRGKHTKHRKLPPNVLQLMEEHWKQFPHVTSHYTG